MGIGLIYHGVKTSGFLCLALYCIALSVNRIESMLYFCLFSFAIRRRNEYLERRIIIVLGLSAKDRDVTNTRCFV